MVVSNLPDMNWSATQILALYRVRWQVELFFKRLKSILQFDHLRAKEPEMVQVYLLAKILAALLIGEAQWHLMVADPDRFQSAQHPISLWRLTQLLFNILRDAIRGTFTFSLLLQNWQQLGRYLCDDPRCRTQQFTSTRISLGLGYVL
jgi:hypothetical protein